MSDIRDVVAVRDLFLAEEENDGYLELEELNEGEQIEFVEATAPEGWEFKVVDIDTRISYDSYGYGSSDGYLIFSVSDESGDQEIYKLPGRYQSFEGWCWDYYSIAPAERKQKVITTWEWTTE